MSSIQSTNKFPKALIALTAAALAVFILCFSFAVPILVRPFYYAQIDALGIPEDSGVSKEEAELAYSEMMDYCIGKTDEFKTGSLKWSEEGKSHFTDCRKLFSLDFLLLSASALVSAIGIMLLKKGRADGYLKEALFWAGAGLLIAIVVIGIPAAFNFEKAFVLFHQLFFPGKENWLFDPKTDEIINILPESFFRNCAVLIAVLILALCIGCMLCGRKKITKNRQKTAD